MSYVTLATKVHNGELTREQAYIEQYKMLNAPLDPRLTAKFGNNAGSKKGLSYLQTHFAIQILNFVFGYGNWDLDILELKEIFREQTEVENKYPKGEHDKMVPRYNSGYTCTARVTVKFMNGVTASYTDVGAGNGQSPHGFWDSVESASKEAVSDTLKRCIRHLGIANQLYDKEQRNVGFNEDTILVIPLTVADVRTLAATQKEATMEYLASVGKSKLTDLDESEMKRLYTILFQGQ